MGTATRGNEAEAAVLAAFAGLGLDVFVPFGSGHPFDLVIYLGEGSFLRVQCKRGWERRGCLIFNCRSTDHGRGPGSYAGVADAFGVYLPSTQDVFVLPIDAVARFEGRLRLRPALNNQVKRTRLAADYEVGRWSLERLRGLAAIS